MGPPDWSSWNRAVERAGVEVEDANVPLNSLNLGPKRPRGAPSLRRETSETA